MNSRNSLLPHHQKLIDDSGISESVSEARGYYSEVVKKRLASMHFSPLQRNVPALVIPIWNISRVLVSWQLRTDKPRQSRGKDVKYETPTGTTLSIDVHPSVREKVLTAAEPLFFTEGVRKADSAVSRGLPCVASLGVDGWTKDEQFWRTVPLKERLVYIIFDSDINTKPGVRQAACRLYRKFESLGARPKILVLPPNGENKVGLDDFFAAGGTANGLLSLATVGPEASDATEVIEPHYKADERGIFRICQSKNGSLEIRISNFSARIISETVFGQSLAQYREFSIEVTTKGKVQLIQVRADEFERMAWVITEVGKDAIIYPGAGRKDEVRAAIQVLSPDIKTYVGIERIGWHCVEGVYFYAHSNGVICAPIGTVADSLIKNRPALTPSQSKGLEFGEVQGTIPPTIEDQLGIRLRIPSSLKRYSLPSPRSGNQLTKDLYDSLQMLRLAPYHISVPVYSAIWLAPVLDADFSIHLYGITGTFKSEFAALATQHFGPDHDARNLLSWSSTVNYIRAMSAYTRNAILTVDDFVPTGSLNDIEKSFRAAEDVLRAQANGVGRGRCRRDGTPQEPESPKCLIISTGEVRASGHSLNSRVISLEVNLGDIANRDNEAKLDLLTRCQKAARSDAFARLTAAYIQWLAEDYEGEQKRVLMTYRKARKDFSSGDVHARTLDAVSKLLAGLICFTEFAKVKCGLSETLSRNILLVALSTTCQVIAGQDQEQSDESPVTRYLNLIRTALATRQGHLQYHGLEADYDPVLGSPEAYGYEKVTVKLKPTRQRGSDEKKHCLVGLEDEPEPKESESCEVITRFYPKGKMLGWVSRDGIFLQPQGSLGGAQQMAKNANEPPIPLSSKALGKRLLAGGYLVSSKSGRNTTRRSINGRKMDVFHLRLRDVIELHSERDVADEEHEEIESGQQQTTDLHDQLADLLKEEWERTHVPEQ